MIFGFIWAPFIIVFFVVALVLTAVLLYVGMQKLDKLDKSPFMAYAGIWTVVTLIFVLVLFIIIIPLPLLSTALI